MSKKISTVIKLAVLSAILLAVAIGLTINRQALAANDTCTWTGGGSDTKASTAGNWTGCDNGNVPQYSDSLIFPDSAVAKTVTMDLPLAFEGVIISGNGYTINNGGAPGFDYFYIDGPSFTISGSNNDIHAEVRFFDDASSTLANTGSNNTIDLLTVQPEAPGFDLIFDITNDLTISNMSQAGTDWYDTIKKIGSGTLTVNHAQPISHFRTDNGIEVNDGTWKCEEVGCFGLTSNEVTVTGGLIDIEVNSDIDNDITFNADTPGVRLQKTDAGTAGLAGTITVSKPATIFVDDDSTLEIADTGEGTVVLNDDLTLDGPASRGNVTIFGAISGAGDLNFLDVDGVLGNETGDGEAANTYTGVTTFTNSGFDLAKNDAIPGDLVITGSSEGNGSVQVDQVAPDNEDLDDVISDSGLVTLNNGGGNFGIITFNSEETIGGLSGDGQVNGNATNLNLSIGADTEFSGTIDANNLNIYGPGTQTLNGDITATSVSLISGLHVFNGTSAALFTFDQFAVVKGTGTVGGLVGEGTLAPGESPGCIHVTNDLDLSGGTLDEEIDGNTVCTQYDQTIVGDTATLGNADLNVSLGFTPSAGKVFTILRAGTISGTFAGLSDGDTFTEDGTTFRINYNLGAGEDTVTLTVVDAADTPNTGLAHTDMRVFAAALFAGSLLLLSQIALVRRFVYGLFKKAS